MVFANVLLITGDTAVKIAEKESMQQLTTTPLLSFSQSQTWQCPCINTWHMKNSEQVSNICQCLIILLKMKVAAVTEEAAEHTWFMSSSALGISTLESCCHQRCERCTNTQPTTWQPTSCMTASQGVGRGAPTGVTCCTRWGGSR